MNSHSRLANAGHSCAVELEAQIKADKEKADAQAEADKEKVDAENP